MGPDVLVTKHWRENETKLNSSVRGRGGSNPREENKAVLHSKGDREEPEAGFESADWFGGKSAQVPGFLGTPGSKGGYSSWSLSRRHTKTRHNMEYEKRGVLKVGRGKRASLRAQGGATCRGREGLGWGKEGKVTVRGLTCYGGACIR